MEQECYSPEKEANKNLSTSRKVKTCQLLSGSIQGRKGKRRSGSRIKQRVKRERSFNVPLLVFYSSFLHFSSHYDRIESNAAGDREETSTTECIDFIQSAKLLENESPIRYRVWKVLQERMDKSLEEKDRMGF